MLTMHMLVRNFLGRGFAYVQHLDDEAHGLAAQWVVAVQQHGGAFDLGDEVVARFAVRAGALDLAADLHAGREVGLGHAGDQRFVALAERVFRGQVHGGLKARLLAFQRGFNLGEQVVVAAVQVGNRLLALVVDEAIDVGGFQTQGNGGVLGDLHKAVQAEWKAERFALLAGSVNLPAQPWGKALGCRPARCLLARMAR